MANSETNAAMVYRLLTECAVVVHQTSDPSDEEWNVYLRQVESHPAITRFLVYTTGGGPNGKQRAALNELCVKREPRLAVMTSAAIVRGMLTALKWMGWSNAQPFALDRVDDAISHLAVSDKERQQVLATLEELKGLAAAHSKTG